MQKSLWIKEVKNLFYKQQVINSNTMWFITTTVDYYFKMRNTQFIKL